MKKTIRIVVRENNADAVRRFKQAAKERGMTYGEALTLGMRLWLQAEKRNSLRHSTQKPRVSSDSSSFSGRSRNPANQ